MALGDAGDPLSPEDEAGEGRVSGVGRAWPAHDYASEHGRGDARMWEPRCGGAIEPGWAL